MEIPLRKLLNEKYPEFLSGLDDNLKLFAKEIRKELRDEGHVVIGITGYPNSGKSNFTAILGALIDEAYDFDFNICFIPTSKEIENKYMNLKMYSFFHIDEASRGLHKHKWHDKVQQKLNELYDTEREGHFLCTALIMPRFQNFAENFRNFMIKYWVNLPCKGLAVFYKRDEDKDAKDPWHIEESYKNKMKTWKGKRVFERTLPEAIRGEQRTDCYWFYCQIPGIPKDIWAYYQELKKQSRVKSPEPEEGETYVERVGREKAERNAKIMSLHNKGHTYVEIGAMMGVSGETVRRSLRDYEAVLRLKGDDVTKSTVSNSILINKSSTNEINQNKEGFDKT